MDARGPPLRPTPRRPCRCCCQEDHHARCRSSSRPRSMQTAAARPSSGIARSDPSPTCLAVLPPFSMSPQRRELRRVPPASLFFPRSRHLPAPRAQASAATRPCLLCSGARHGGRRLYVSIRPPPAPNPRWCPPGTRHGGCRLFCLDSSASKSTAEQPRSVARSVTPRPTKASAEADKARRKLGSPAASAPSSSPPCQPRPPSATSLPCSRAPAATLGLFLQKRNVISHQEHIKIGLRVNFL